MKFLFLICFSLSLLVQPVSGQTSKEAWLEASNYLIHVVSTAKPYFTSYGASSFEQLNEAEIGTPIQCYALPMSITNHSIEQLTLTNEWLFPVTYTNKAFNIIRVYLRQGKWTARLSMPVFTELEVLKKTWPEEKGFHPKIIVCPIFDGYFFNIPEAPLDNLTDLQNLIWQHPPELSPASVNFAIWGR